MTGYTMRKESKARRMNGNLPRKKENATENSAFYFNFDTKVIKKLEN